MSLSANPTVKIFWTVHQIANHRDLQYPLQARRDKDMHYDIESWEGGKE